MTEHAQLLAKTYQGRVDWLRKTAVYKPGLGLWLVRVDGHLAATGEDDEPEEDLIARFLMYLARPVAPRRTGGMG
jgi:hypothetical protein